MSLRLITGQMRVLFCDGRLSRCILKRRPLNGLLGLVCLSWSLTVSAQMLPGRLFMTQAERRWLSEQTSQTSAEAHQRQILHLNGFVKNNRNHSVHIWLNDREKSAATRPGIEAAPRLLRKSQVGIQFKGRYILLRPGQKLDVNTLQVDDVLQLENERSASDEAPAEQATKNLETQLSRQSGGTR